MRPLRVLLGALALSALFMGGSVVGWALAASSTVSLTKDGPSPATVTVDWNDTVVFSNTDTVPRSVISQRAPFDSGVIPPGGSWEYRFDGRAGQYRFNQMGTRPTTSGIVVVDISGKVTLRASKQVVPYGKSVALTGRSSYAGTPVVIQMRPAGAEGDWATALTLNAAADGAYAGALKMTEGGRMRALVAADQLRSSIVSVDVLPRVQARVSRNRVKKGSRIVVTGKVLPAGAATRIDLEELVKGRSTWSRKATKRLSKTGTVTFVVTATEGRMRLRLALKRGNVDPGFVPTVSKALLVVGT